MSKHFKSCEAPICVENHNNDLVWYAGEKICSKQSKFKWHKTQKRINKHILSNPNVYYKNDPLDIRLLESRVF